MTTSDTPTLKVEPYELTGEPWEAEALSLFNTSWLEHQGRDIRICRSLQERIARDAPAHIEIGSHRARFLIGLTKTYSDQQVMGFEIRPKYTRLANEYLAKHQILNAHQEKIDAKLAMIIAVPLESLDAVYVNFPDPWWKDKHEHRRLLDIPFLRVIARRLKPRGRLYLKSDVFEYLHAVRRFAEQSEMFRPLPPERWPDERTWTWTAREAKCMRDAIPFGRGYYERLPNLVIERPQVPEPRPNAQWDDMVTAVDEIRGRPTIDKKMRAWTVAAGKEKATDTDDSSS